MVPQKLFNTTTYQEPMPAQPTPRLESDDLYIWARLVSDLEHAQRALNEFGKGALSRRGLALDRYYLTNDGYIRLKETQDDEADSSG